MAIFGQIDQRLNFTFLPQITIFEQNGSGLTFTFYNKKVKVNPIPFWSKMAIL